MIAKVSSRRHTITIGGQDWSTHYARLTIGRSSLSDDANPGEFVMVGELEISNTLSVPESIDPKENPIRWRAGQDIFVQARNDANTAWINTSYSYLKILKVPARPGRGNLVLDVGCRLQWALQSQFDGDRSGIVYGQPETSDIVARRLLEASGLAAGNISLSAWPYSLQRPIGKQQSSYAGQACDLAYANDWLYLYQDVNGNITDSQLNLNVGSAIATVTVGTDDLVYEPAEEPERPPEKTKVAGQGYEFTTISNPLVEIDEVREDFSNFSPTLAGRSVSSRTTTTKSFTTGANPTYTERVQESKVEALIFQNPQTPGQILSYRDHVVFEQYETGKEDPSQARLISVDETERVRGRSIRPEDALVNMRETIRNRLDITYAPDNDVIARWQSIERQAETLLDENSDDPWRQREIINEDFQWTEYAPGKFDRVDEVGRALVLEDSSLDRSFQKPFSLRVQSKRYDRSNDNKPFETKYFDPGVAEAERQYEATVVYIPDGGPSGRDRERLFTVADGFGFSAEQMQGLAEKHLGIMIGRNRQYEIELAVNDALLQAGPLPQVDVTDFDTLTYSYLADALTFEVTQTKMSALCFGIWIDGGYEPVVNIAAIIPAGQFVVEIIQSSFAIAATIPASQFTVDVAQSFAISATIPAGQLTTEIVIDVTIDIAAVIPLGNLAVSIAPDINIAAQIPAGDLAISIAPDINIAAVIPTGVLVTNVVAANAVNFSNVQLLLEGEGANGSTTFTDGSSAARAPSAVGAGTTITTAQFQVGSSSIDFDGVNSVLEYADSGDFTAAGDLSWEFWARITDFASTDGGANRAPLATANSFTVSTPGLLLSPIDATTGNLLFFNGSTRITAGPIAINVWTHIAVCRVGGVWTIYLDGSANGGTYSNSTAFNPLLIRIGSSVSSTVGNYEGQMDSIRFVVGESAYDGNFTPPTSPHPTS